jgi:hypothetical protein
MGVVAKSVGIKRLCFSPSIIHPLGDPSLPLEQEKEFRLDLTREALDKLKLES